MRTLIILVTLCLALPYSAQAKTVQQVFRDFGLIGVWARACDLPADLDAGNSRAIYALYGADGVVLTYDNGPKYKPSVFNVVSAEPMGRDGLRYVEQRLNSSARTTVMLRRFGREIGVMSSITDAGEVLVKDGRFVSTGLVNPRQSLCRN